MVYSCLSVGDLGFSVETFARAPSRVGVRPCTRTKATCTWTGHVRNTSSSWISACILVPTGGNAGLDRLQSCLQPLRTSSGTVFNRSRATSPLSFPANATRRKNPRDRAFINANDRASAKWIPFRVAAGSFEHRFPGYLMRFFVYSCWYVPVLTVRDGFIHL